MLAGSPPGSTLVIFTVRELQDGAAEVPPDPVVDSALIVAGGEVPAYLGTTLAGAEAVQVGLLLREQRVADQSKPSRPAS